MRPAHLQTLVVAVAGLFACQSASPGLLHAQSKPAPSAAKNEDSQFARPVRREVPRVERALVRDDVAFIEWPPELVGTGALTAFNLKTGQLKWTCPVEPSIAASLSVAGDYIVEGRLTSNGREDRLIHRATGETHALPLGDAQAAVPKVQRVWHGELLVHDDWMVTYQIVRLSDRHVVREIDFPLRSAVSHRGKLYTYGDRDHRLNGEYVIRRTDLETGREELEVPVVELLAGDSSYGFGGIVAVSGDVVAISTTWRPTPNDPAVHGYTGFNLVARRELWRAEVERRFGSAPVQFRHPDGLGLSNPIENWNPPRQRPLLIDLTTGAMQPDPDWRDPYSLLNWHIGGSHLSTGMYNVEHRGCFVARNDRHAVTLLSKTTLICVDMQTGALAWKHDVGGNQFWPAITSAGNLGEYVMVPLPGGVEVFEISTGQRRVINPIDVGLTAVVDPPLPAAASIPVETGRVAHAKHDWWIDSLIQSLIALPLVAWGVYFFVRRRISKRLPPRSDSPK
ncbi:MAG: hypothetical protein H7062_26235 [Candidatus Saccharimonas sp.]|nr:hypothetical protein [Planctomycetaceae bacterium]